MFGSVGCSTTRAMLPVSRRPRNAQVAPPSVERYTPPPHVLDWRLFCSPVPAQMTFESPAKIARSPKEFSPVASKIGVQLMPWLVVFQIPPPAAAR